VREKDKKKRAYYLFFLDKLVLLYYVLVILGPYFRGHKFFWKKNLGLI
jgi:hypothetical protein